jgi:hypothetical protein
LQYIYTAEIVFPADPLETFEILKLGVSYKVDEVDVKCEEDMSNKLNCWNILPMIVLIEQNLDAVTEDFADKCQSNFLADFENVKKEFPDVETKIAAIPG